MCPGFSLVEWAMRKEVLIYGMLGGILIAGLKLIEYRWLVVEHSIEIYGGLVAAVFAGLGIWLGLRLTRNKSTIVVQKIEVLAGNRGLDMVKNSNGETVFLIGNFITFESADEYVSLLVRNGYGSARVAAYVDRQEIPVEAARELVNKMPDD